MTQDPTPLTYRHYSPALNPDECVSVDGNPPARLNLSHWPGNTTPKELKHDLSTGICLNCVSRKDLAERLAGIKYVTNNHWDTDGACSVYTMLHPDNARTHSHVILAAALAGDMGIFTTPEGLKIDLTLTALSKRADSPVCSDNYTDDLERRQAQYDYAIELLPRLIENPDLHAAWFAEEWWTINRDLRDLREEIAPIEHFGSLDFAIARTERPLHETAVNTAAGADRILTVEQVNGGFHYLLRLTTYSWFELVSRPYLPRPEWQPLVDDLNAKCASAGGQWRADDISDPTPSLAFRNEVGGLAPSRADPAAVRAAMVAFFSQHPVLHAGI